MPIKRGHALSTDEEVEGEGEVVTTINVSNSDASDAEDGSVFVGNGFSAVFVNITRFAFGDFTAANDYTNKW